MHKENEGAIMGSKAKMVQQRTECVENDGSPKTMRKSEEVNQIEESTNSKAERMPVELIRVSGTETPTNFTDRWGKKQARR